jgi:hypothetical protein
MASLTLRALKYDRVTGAAITQAGTADTLRDISEPGPRAIPVPGQTCTDAAEHAQRVASRGRQRDVEVGDPSIGVARMTRSRKSITVGLALESPNAMCLVLRNAMSLADRRPR